MKGKLTLMLIAIFALSLFSAYAAVTSAVGVTTAAPGSVTESTQGNVAVDGGNTTEVNLTSDSNTGKWQGFYGDITGSLRLGDGANVLFDFGLTTFQAVFASSSNAVTFGALSPVLVGSQAAVDTAYSFSAADPDSITNVLDDVANCNAGTEIAAATGVYTLNSTVNSTWQTCVANYTAIAVDGMVYGTNVVSAGADSFLGSSVEYQLMVPVDSTGDLYYFYLEI